MKVARFDPHGPPLHAEVWCRPNRNGSYRIMLWAAGKNEVVEEHRGNFVNTDDDEYALADPPSKQDGRLVEAMIVVAIPGGVGDSDVELVVSQGGRELARDGATVAPGSPGQLVDAFVRLEAR